MTAPTNELSDMRQEAGVTQEQIARLLGLSAKTPHNWEHMPAAKVKPFHRVCYQRAIEAALKGDLVIARYRRAA